MSKLFGTHFVNQRATEAHQGNVKAAAFESLQRIVDEGKARTAETAHRILSEVPEDRIARTSNMSFQVEPGKLHTQTEGMGRWNITHDHAVNQLCDRLGTPRQYMRELINAAPQTEGMGDGIGSGLIPAWQHTLAQNILEEHAKHDNSRMLVRSYKGQTRAFLSDRYRRLDSRPLLVSFLEGCEKVGAVPVEGVSSDVKASVRAIIPRVFEPVAGEFMIMGLNWQNSDYGSGAYAVSFFAMRLLCQNGMVGESNIKQVHLGGRLPDGIQFSAETYRKDTEVMSLATRDVVSSLLSEGAIDKRMGLIAGAASKEVTFNQAIRSVSQQLTKGEREEAKRLFEGKDEILLPAGSTAWRFSNAISWLANETESPDRRIELQQIAGRLAAA